MSTDKTLADVQPGGRVRLGDQAERARFEAWPQAREFEIQKDGSGEYLSEVTHGAWLAWKHLSAQPHPGGQDALQQEYDKLLAAFDRQVEAAEKIAARVLQQDDRIEELEEALAARQPVTQGCDACDRTGIRQNDEGRNICCPDCDLGSACAGDTRQSVGEQLMEMRICELRHVSLKPNRPYIFTVDANCANCRADAAYAMGHTDTRPAQAVDLGPLWVSVNDRLPSEDDYGESGEVVVRYRYNTPNSVQGSWDVGESRHDADDIEWNNGWLFGSCDYAEVSHWMPKHALLALIDSQAVRNG